MKKFVFIITLTCFPVSIYAQSFDLASGITEDEPQQEEKIESVKEKEQVADDRGIFSFLNFSFIKKQSTSESSTENNDIISDINDTDLAVEDTTVSKIDKDKNNISSKQPPKKETPLEKMTRLAENGQLDAQLSLGYMYLYGQDGVNVNYEKAFYFYELAAKQNNAIALNNLGSLYFNGIGTEIDYQKAAQLFYKAAQNGSDDAAVNLAFIYLSSDNTEGQHNEAIKLFQAASEAGNNTAKFMLGYAYYMGFIVEQNYHKAIILIKEAANANFDIAQYMLGIMYRDGNGIAKNYGNAVKNLRLSVNQGNVPAMMELGTIYKEGTIYPKNDYRAHILFNVASVYDAPDADIYRDEVEKNLKIENLLQAQTAAEKFKEKPSELTKYIRQTYGSDVRIYIDENIKKQKNKARNNEKQ